MSRTLSLPNANLQTIHQTLLRFAPDAVLVGGAVRDILLGQLVHDLDYVVEGDGLTIGRQLADELGAAYYPLDESRKIARVVWKLDDPPLVVDISSLIGMTLEEDIRRRDFTINAIAMLPDGTLFDLLGGVDDLEQHVLRLCSPDSLHNDPVRVIRAVRFLYLFDLTPDPGLAQLVWYAAPRLSRVSPERQRDEFVKALALPRPHLIVDRLVDWRVADELMPELVALHDVQQPEPHMFDVYRHTLETLRWMGRLDAWLLGADAPAKSDAEALIHQRLASYRPLLHDYLQKPLTAERPLWLWLRFAAIAHDWGKPRAFREDEMGGIRFYKHEQLSGEMVAAWMQRYHCAKNETSFVQRVCEAHMRPMSLFIAGDTPSKRTLYRFYRDLEDAAPATILLFLADFLGTRGKEIDLQDLDVALDYVDAFLQPFAEANDALFPAPLLNGRELIEIFELKPGPHIGQLLAALQEAQATGEVETREQAVGYIEALLAQGDYD